MTKLLSADIVDEYRWLVGNGVHPLLAADQLNKKPAAMSMFLRRNAPDLWLEFDRAWKGSSLGRW